MKGIELLALDKNFNIVSLINYSNLQWNRKFYEPGSFSVQISLEQYSTDFKYLYTNDRPEMGEISQVNYKYDGLNRYVALSGYFLENRLNRMIAYAKANVTNITNQPSWTNQSGNAEDVAFAYFNGFKELSWNGGSADLNILTGTNNHLGKFSDHSRRNEHLGAKIYSILKPSRMSYRVQYDLNKQNMTFSCYQGIDRTSDNEELNNPIVFSTDYGNLINPDILISSTDYKNSFIDISTVTDSDSKKETVTIYVGSENELNEPNLFVQINSSLNADDYSNTEDMFKALSQEGHNELLEHKNILSINFDTIIGSYEYINDFDLGDLCSIEITDFNLSADAVLTSIYEVIKKGQHILNLEFEYYVLYKGGINQ